MQCISVLSNQGKATQCSMGPVIELCCVVRPGAVSMYKHVPVYIQHTYLGLYPTAKASYMYMYVHGMYSAIQLERFGHRHTLHMLCKKDFEWLYLMTPCRHCKVLARQADALLIGPTSTSIVIG